MKRIAILAVGLISLTACTPTEINAWLKWHRSDPQAAQEHLQKPEVQEELSHHVSPPPLPSSTESSNGRCIGMEGLLAQYNPGWNVTSMSQIMYRESRCQPGVSNSCCHGLLQIHEMHVGWMGDCGVYSASDLYNAERNICAAAMLWRKAGGSNPWAQTR